MIAAVIVLVVFFIFGIVLSSGRGSFLIAGFNMMPEEEQQKYDEIALCKFMGKISFALCFSLLFFILSTLLDATWPDVVGGILMIGICLFAISYTLGFKRFLK